MNKLEAVFIGGDRNGATVTIDKPHPEMTSVVRVMERNGQFREVFRTKYKLVSYGPPLRYEADDSD